MLIMSLGVGGCFDKQEDASDRLNVVCTIGMITDMVQIVGGDRVDVIGLMGPGIDPHLYRASEGDVKRLNKAHIIFYGGLHQPILYRMAYPHLYFTVN